MTRQFHFLTFGGGRQFPGAAKRIAKQAQQTGLFASVSYETGEGIFSKWEEFQIHRPFVEGNAKGWGYWIWKPFLIGNYLNAINEGDALIYMDAGCEILPSNSQHFAELFSHFNHRDQLLFNYAEYPIFNIVFWSKQALLDKMMEEYDLPDATKIAKTWAGALGLTRTSENLSLVADWYRLASENDYRFLDDSLSTVPQASLFFEHRHDQSILSLLVAAYRMESSGSAFDYCFGKPHIEQWPDLLNKPFLAMRNESYQSQTENTPNVQTKSQVCEHESLNTVYQQKSCQKPMGWSQATCEALTAEHYYSLGTLGLV